MDLDGLKDLDGRNCILLESGRGMAVKLVGFFEEGGMINANTECISENGFSYNLIIMPGESWLKEWWVTNIGVIIKNCTQSAQIYRNGDYLYFGMYGSGVRLFFSNELVNKVIRKEV